MLDSGCWIMGVDDVSETRRVKCSSLPKNLEMKDFSKNSNPERVE
jgi:hypothetical protein